MQEQQAIKKNKKLKYKDIIKKISEMSGLRLKTVERTLAEYKTKETVSSVNKKKFEKQTILTKTPLDKGSIIFNLIVKYLL